MQNYVYISNIYLYVLTLLAIAQAKAAAINLRNIFCVRCSRCGMPIAGIKIYETRVHLIIIKWLLCVCVSLCLCVCKDTGIKE